MDKTPRKAMVVLPPSLRLKRRCDGWRWNSHIVIIRTKANKLWMIKGEARKGLNSGRLPRTALLALDCLILGSLLHEKNKFLFSKPLQLGSCDLQWIATLSDNLVQTSLTPRVVIKAVHKHLSSPLRHMAGLYFSTLCIRHGLLLALANFH